MPGRAVQSHLVAAIEQLLLVGEVETETVTLRNRVQTVEITDVLRVARPV